MKNNTKFILTIIISISFLVSSNIERNNYFLGKWEIDIQKTLSFNDLPNGMSQISNINSSDYTINFDLAGKYSEKLGPQTIEGTWSRYKTDMAVARLDRDKNIRRRKKRLKQRLSNSRLSRYEKTRLQQKEYFLNRASIKSFEHKNGFIILNLIRPDKDIKLFFRRVI